MRVDEKVINLIEKIRRALKLGQIQQDNFPTDEINNLMEYTLGKTFWDCIGSRPNYGFGNLPEVYKECLADAVKRNDMEECGRILHLFECTYQIFYTALDEEEKIFRQKPYRQMIIDLGTANAQMQYRLHRERQKVFAGRETYALGEGKGVVYTCLLGEGALNQPEEVSARVDYLCFTDDEEKWGKKEGVWKFCAVEQIDGQTDVGEMHKDFLESQYKIMAHKLLKEYDYSVWVAPDITITGDILRFGKVYGEGMSLLTFLNAEKDCMYEDMSVTQMGTDELNIQIRKAMLRYRKEGYPEHNGLIDGRVIMRNHRDEALGKVMEKWWEEIKNGNIYSANIFNYMAWKQQYPFSVCNLFIYHNLYFKISEIDLDTHDEL